MTLHDKELILSYAWGGPASMDFAHRPRDVFALATEARVRITEAEVRLGVEGDGL